MVRQRARRGKRVVLRVRVKRMRVRTVVVIVVTIRTVVMVVATRKIQLIDNQATVIILHLIWNAIAV